MAQGLARDQSRAENPPVIARVKAPCFLPDDCMLPPPFVLNTSLDISLTPCEFFETATPRAANKTTA